MRTSQLGDYDALVPTTPSSSLPQQQRAWDTRERILAAAVECLAEEGYAATTTARIQARSGVSRGSMLHQFPSKDALLLAAMARLVEVRRAELEARADRLDDVGDAVEALWDTFRGPLFRATLDLWVAAQHNPDMAVDLARYEHELGREIRTLIARLFGARNAARKGFPDLVSLLLSSMRGTALTYTFQPREHAEEPMLVLWKKLAKDALR